MPFPAAIELSAISAGDGSQGFAVTGIGSTYSVASLGDINGDGLDDFIVGDTQADPSARSNAGQSYVVFGSATGFSGSLAVSSLDGLNGFVVNGIDRNDFSGYSVASAGDVNGDGIGDLIIGAYGADPGGRSGAGETYIVYGTAAGYSASLDLSALDGTNGFIINGIDGGDQSGSSVASAGDVNGDGIGDLIIGAPGAYPGGETSAGESYVVFGTDAGFSASLDLSGLDGTNGFVLTGIDAADLSGNSVAGAGDLNGDGIGDIVIGAFGGDPGGLTDAGETYVVFGTDAGFSASLDLSTLNGTNGFVVNGIDAADISGYSVASAGDVNGDGIGDLMIGGYAGDPGGNVDAGETYIVFGTAAGFSASLDLSALDGTNGFVINGIAAGDLSGISVASAGDVNGDGVGDMIIGAYTADPGGNTDAGQSYVVFGSTAGFSASLDLSTLNGVNGFALNGGGLSGVAVSGAGDVNGDGYDDVLVGALSGGAYVVFGGPVGQTEGTSGDDVLTGARGEDTLNGYGGNDTLIGSGSPDVMAGGAGDDFYESVTTADTVIELEGEGTDTIRTRVDGFTLGGNVENLVLFGTAITGNGNALGNRLAGTSGDNSLYGFNGNDVLEGRGGNDTLHGGAGDDFYESVTPADIVIELEGEGTDTVRTRFDYTLGDNVENLRLFGVAVTGSGNALGNSITGTSGDNTLFGLDGNDTLSGLGGADALHGGVGDDVYLSVDADDTVVELFDEGSDSIHTRLDNYVLGENVENLVLRGSGAVTGTGNELGNFIGAISGVANVLYGLGGNDVMDAGGGNDTLYGGADQDGLNGGSGMDLLYGGDGIDYLDGGSGNDSMFGDAGTDHLSGRAGRDTLTGGADADFFIFVDGDFASLASSTDTIADFSRADGDLIDLSRVDAIFGTPESDSFAFIGTAEFSNTAGELRYLQRDGFAIIQGDNDGDGLADFQIRVDGVTDLVAADFMF